MDPRNGPQRKYHPIVVPLLSNSPRTDPKENASSCLGVVAKQHPQNGPKRKRPRYIATATRKQTNKQTNTQTNPASPIRFYIYRFYNFFFTHFQSSNSVLLT
jgi:hypothetical protein